MENRKYQPIVNSAQKEVSTHKKEPYDLEAEKLRIKKLTVLPL
jgi:hypothetical protein